jgi:copper transport protein
VGDVDVRESVAVRRRVRIGVVGLMTIAGLTLGANPVLAHAGLEASDPADGAVLDAPPERVVLTFSEPPDLTLSTLGMLDATGANVSIQDPEVVAGSSGLQVALVPVETLGDGVYTVTFRVVSRTDGHLTAGSVAFGVGQVTGDVVPTANAPTEAPWPSALSVIGKILLYVGLALIFGAAVVGMGAFGGEVPARRLLLPLASVSALIGSVLMLFAEARSVGAGLDVIVRSDAGGPFLRLIAVCAVVVVVSSIAGYREGGIWLAGAGEVAALAMLVRASGGHAGGHPLQVVVQWIHFMVIAIWVGGFTLLWLLLHTRRGSEPPAEEARSYSRLAGLALLVVIVSGFVRAFDELGGWSGLTKILETSYGVTLVIKVAIVVGLIGLGAVNRYRGIPRIGDGAPLLTRVVGVEVVTAVAILGVTATLTGLSPHPQTSRPGQDSAAAAAITIEGSDFATTMHVTLTLTPGAPGLNGYELHVVDFDSGDALPADSVSLRFEAVGRSDIEPSQTDLVLDPDGHWTAEGTELSVPGPWTVTALVTTGAEATEVPMRVSVEPAGQRMDVAAQPGQPTIVTFTTSDGEQLQYYADPGVAGTNQLHITAFGADGLELPLQAATIVVTPSEGAPQVVDVTRFGPGHFVANAALEAGVWHVDLVATTQDGGVLTGAYDQMIGQG